MNDRNARFSGGSWVAVAVLIGMGMLIAVAATANEPPVPDQVQGQQQGQGQVAVGVGGPSSATVDGVLGGASTVTANPVVTASPSYSERSTTIALGSTAPNVVQVSDCIVPARGLFKRGQGWLWGMFQITPVTELDPLCVAEKRVEAQTELDRVSLQIRLIEAENKRERLIIERMRLEAEVEK